MFQLHCWAELSAYIWIRTNCLWELVSHLTCVIIETRCLHSPCFTTDIFVNLPSPSSGSFSVYPRPPSPCCAVQCFIKDSALPRCLHNDTSVAKNLFVSLLMRLSESIALGEHESTHSCADTLQTKAIKCTLFSALSERFLTAIYCRVFSNW